MIRILHVSPDLYPYSWGGIAVHTYLMAKYQAELGHSVAVLTVDDGDGVARPDQPFDVVRLRGVRDPLGNPIVPDLAQFVHEQVDDYDIVNLHSHLFTLCISTAWTVPEGGPPLILTCHGVRSAAVPLILSDLYLGTVVRATMPRLQKTLCYSDTDARAMAFATKTPLDKFVIVPSGVPLEFFKPEVPPIARDPVVLWAGRMVQLKGLETLVRAFALVVNENPTAILKLIGSGPGAERVRKSAAKLGVLERIELIEEVPFEMMPNLYNRSKVCVVASKTEGMPRILMEALACGVPVVASALPQLSMLSNKGVILFNPDSVEELAGALSSVLSDTDSYGDSCREARMSAAKWFDWRTTVKSTLEVFSKELRSG